MKTPEPITTPVATLSKETREEFGLRDDTAIGIEAVRMIREQAHALYLLNVDTTDLLDALDAISDKLR